MNHLEAHALTARLPGLDPEGAPFPYLLLLMSGGHCQCVLVRGVGQLPAARRHDRRRGRRGVRQGRKLLGLGWPGGPALERLAAQGEPTRYALPRPLLGRPGCDFSFSGLKTRGGAGGGAASAGRAAGRGRGRPRGQLSGRGRRRARRPGEERDRHGAGGEAAGRGGRRRLERRGAHARLRQAAGGRRAADVRAAPARLCTDNAVMVAWAGIARLRLGLTDGLGFSPRPRWPLEQLGVNYRHAFHAGNFADCFKHALFVWLLRAMARKPAPFLVLDTHGRRRKLRPVRRRGRAHRRVAARRGAAVEPAAGAGRLRGARSRGSRAPIPARR